MNTTGNMLRLTTFGESHGPALGGVLDGMPGGLRLDMERVCGMIDRRRTGRDPLTSQRREADKPEILSGLSRDGVTLGTPIGFIFRNTDARSRDYSDVETHFRPNHADFAYEARYGIRDPRGGGRASARETLCRVAGGAMALQLLERLVPGIEIEAAVTAVGKAGYPDLLGRLAAAGASAALPHDEAVESAMRECVARAREDSDSVGGTVTCLIKGLPAGVGNPIYDKLSARLAEAMVGINAVKGIEFGLGAEAAAHRGTEVLDLYNENFTPAVCSSNFSGGIQGGISNGMPIFFSVHFKPTPTIARGLPMPDADGKLTEICVKGRHDPCVALRAPVVVEAMAALTICDLVLGLCGGSAIRPSDFK